MYVHVQHPLPGVPLEHATAHLHVHIAHDGLVVIGWSVHDTANLDQLALGCTHALDAQNGSSTARAVLEELLGLLPTLVDAPPFP